MNCTPLQTEDVKCESLTYPRQQGTSGKTSIHQKFKSGKRPQGKFTSLKK